MSVSTTRNPATKDAMISALDVQSVHLDMSRSIIAGHLPQSETSVSQLEGPGLVPVQQKTTVSLSSQPVRQQRGAHGNIHEDSSPITDTRAESVSSRIA
jgi:hypothetical protein